jgi:hypothetical protein
MCCFGSNTGILENKINIKMENQGKSKKQIESSNIGCFFSGIGLLIMVMYLIIGGIL